MQLIECQCSGPGFCPLRGRQISQNEYDLCACKCANPVVCEPTRCYRRRERWAAIRDGRPVEHAPQQPPATPRAPVAPWVGPGTKLTEILHALGAPAPAEGCKCKDRARLMDEWGPGGCEERRGEIRTWLDEKYREVSWGTLARMASRAALRGLVSIDAIISEAVRQSRATQLPAGTRLSGDRAVVTCATGDLGRKILDVSRPSLEAYAARVGADFHVIDAPWVPEFPLYAKFMLSKIVPQYRRTLFLDADLLVRPTCPDLFAVVPAGTLGLHDDAAYLKNPDHFGRQLADTANKHLTAFDAAQVRRSVQESLTVWNTGVIVADRDHAPLFAPPDRPFVPYHCFEQDLITARVIASGVPVTRLPLAYNYQWWMGKTLAGRHDKHIVHVAGAGHMWGEGERLQLMREVAEECR